MNKPQNRNTWDFPSYFSPNKPPKNVFGRFIGGFRESLFPDIFDCGIHRHYNPVCTSRSFGNLATNLSIFSDQSRRRRRKVRSTAC